MSLETILVVLLLVVALLLANLLVVVMLWRRHDEMSARVIHVEARLSNALSHVEVRQLFERMSSLDGQMQTISRLMQTVQEHLLESDR